MAFPTLSIGPSSYRKEPQDSDMRSGFEGGYAQARPRFTRNIFLYHIGYETLTAADKALLETHRDSVKSTVIFAWVDPTDGVTKNVRYQKRMVLDHVPSLF